MPSRKSEAIRDAVLVLAERRQQKRTRRGLSAVAEYVETDIGSHYGSTDSREFFAESFASMTGGRPNAYGKAMRDWFGKRR